VSKAGLQIPSHPTSCTSPKLKDLLDEHRVPAEMPSRGLRLVPTSRISWLPLRRDTELTVGAPRNDRWGIGLRLPAHQG
jgi:hypothetical protein